MDSKLEANEHDHISPGIISYIDIFKNNSCVTSLVGWFIPPISPDVWICWDPLKGIPWAGPSRASRYAPSVLGDQSSCSASTCVRRRRRVRSVCRPSGEKFPGTTSIAGQPPHGEDKGAFRSQANWRSADIFLNRLESKM